MTAHGMIVEDLSPVREWLLDLCHRLFPDVPVTACNDLASALVFLQRLSGSGSQLAFALIDLGLPDGSGIDLIRDISRHHPAAMPIVTTIYGDDQHIFEAIAAGAQGYLLKDDAPTSFEANLLRIHNGEPPLSPAVARRIMAYFRDTSSTREVELTPRETQVLSLLALGMRIQEIARDLCISEHTARDYVKAIYAKLNISSRAEAAIEAARRRLVSL
jgi:DNA-binding NarL/FixJ family response regulator